MSPVITAYNALLNIAQNGRPFVDGEVFFPIPTADDDPRRTLVIGHGYDFERSVTVADQSTGKEVPGVAKLRVIRMTKGGNTTLFLRARLEWTTSNGAQHASYASYNLTAEAANQLAAQSRPDYSEFEDLDSDAELTPELREKAMDALASAVSDGISYQASWVQTFPGSDLGMEDVFDAGEEQLATLEESAEYHSRAVLDAMEAEPQLLCMLSDQDMGAVGPDELVKLHAWVITQPEVAVQP